MRFCAVLGVYPKNVPGGAEVQSYLICKELARRGYDSHYVAHSSESSLTKIDEGIKVHQLDPNQTSLREKINYLSEINADVYYFRNKKDITLASICSRIFDALVLYNISSDYLCKPIYSIPKKQSFDINGVIGSFRLMYQKSLYGIPDKLLAQTETQKNLLEEHRGIDAKIVPNGHPVPDPPFRKTEPQIILWLASLKSRKQPEVFINLSKQCTDLDAQFWIVGRPSDKDVSNMVRSETSDLENIEYKGGCTYNQSHSYFSKASLFVNTSVAGTEGFPNTFVQSWLHETPVISLHKDVDGMLNNKEAGVLANDFDKLTQFLRELITNDSDRCCLGSRARQIAIEKYSVEVVCDKLESVLRDFGDCFD